MTNTDSINTVSHKRGCLLKALEEKSHVSCTGLLSPVVSSFVFYTLNAYS